MRGIVTVNHQNLLIILTLHSPCRSPRVRQPSARHCTRRGAGCWRGLSFRPTNPRTLTIPPLPGLGTQGPGSRGLQHLHPPSCPRGQAAGRRLVLRQLPCMPPATPCSPAGASSLIPCMHTCRSAGDGGASAVRFTVLLVAGGARLGACLAPALGRRRLARILGDTIMTGVPCAPRTEGLAMGGSGQSFFPCLPRRARLRLRLTNLALTAVLAGNACSYGAGCWSTRVAAPALATCVLSPSPRLKSHPPAVCLHNTQPLWPCK